MKIAWELRRSTKSNSGTSPLFRVLDFHLVRISLLLTSIGQLRTLETDFTVHLNKRPIFEEVITQLDEFENLSVEPHDCKFENYNCKNFRCAVKLDGAGLWSNRSGILFRTLWRSSNLVKSFRMVSQATFYDDSYFFHEFSGCSIESYRLPFWPTFAEAMPR